MVTLTWYKFGFESYYTCTVTILSLLHAELSLRKKIISLLLYSIIHYYVGLCIFVYFQTFLKEIESTTLKIIVSIYSMQAVMKTSEGFRKIFSPRRPISGNFLMTMKTDAGEIHKLQLLCG